MFSPDEDSIYPRAFHVGWPEAPHRVLRCAIEAAGALQSDTVGKVINIDGMQADVPRFASTVADRTATGHVAAIALSIGWGGEECGARRDIRELNEEAEKLLHRQLA